MNCPPGDAALRAGLGGALVFITRTLMGGS